MSLINYMGRVFSGLEMNEIVGGIPLIKFMNNNDMHRGMQYVDGDNLDTQWSFRGHGECKKGGLYATTILDYMDHYYSYGIMLGESGSDLWHWSISKVINLSVTNFFWKRKFRKMNF